MSVLYGDTGIVSEGVLKEFTIELKPATENNVTLDPTNPIFTNNLPLAQDPNVGFTLTVTEEMLPAINPKVPTKYTAVIFLSGYNGTTGSASVNVDGYVNGIKRGNAGGVTATTSSRYWMLTVWKFFDVVPGDELSVKLWASVENVTFDYVGYQFYPTQPEFTKKGQIIKDVSFTNFQNAQLVANQPGANFSSPNQQATGLYINNIHYLSLSGNASYSALGNDLGYMWRTAVGDITQNNVTNYSHSSLRYYQRLSIPGKVTFRELSR